MWVTYDHIDLFELTNHGLIVDDNQREMANVIISEDFFCVCFKLKQQINKALSLLKKKKFLPTILLDFKWVCVKISNYNFILLYLTVISTTF